MPGAFRSLSAIRLVPTSWTAALALTAALGLPASGIAETYTGTPSNYLALLEELAPGDVLELEAGTYTDGLPVYSLNGTAQEPIIIRGPASSPRAIFLGSDTSNTVRIWESSYVEIYNLELNGMNRAGDGVNADGRGDWAHHITIDNFLIYGYAADQSIVGISTNGCTTWGWTIRNNVITEAGTGMYLGNSPGTNPFIGGLIEHNVVLDTLGYNIEIKHQNGRPDIAGIPTDTQRTIIRHNVFSKANNAAGGAGARPNLLVGHFPLSGNGSDDMYEIYGNFFYDNPTESLFQGEGNVALYANVLINEGGSAVRIMAHNDRPRKIRVFRNTVLAADTGISISGVDTSFEQFAIGNAVFAGAPLQGGTQQGNITDSLANASDYLVSPGSALGSLSVVPRTGALTSAALSPEAIQGYTDAGLDFEGRPYDERFRGAYAIEGGGESWTLALERKPVPPAGGEPPKTPRAPANLIAE